MSKRVFVTGIAGFIGFHAARALKKRGDEVVGIDNFNAYYDPTLKRARAQLLAQEGIAVHEGEITAPEQMALLLQSCTHVLHLAAQAGVRYARTHPHVYIKSNIEGFLSLLELLKHFPHIPLIYASSSSVYGTNTEVPFATTDRTDHPANLYAATKKANELMAYSYHHMYGLKTTGLRYFTVYGPWGRPDMAYFSFTKAILEGTPIQLFNRGEMWRDFTYIDDIVSGTLAALDLAADCEVFNLGNHKVESLKRFVHLLEEAVGKKAHLECCETPPGEMIRTYADIEAAQQQLGFKPQTSLEEGLQKFVKWYQEWSNREKASGSASMRSEAIIE